MCQQILSGKEIRQAAYRLKPANELSESVSGSHQRLRRFLLLSLSPLISLKDSNFFELPYFSFSFYVFYFFSFLYFLYSLPVLPYDSVRYKSPKTVIIENHNISQEGFALNRLLLLEDDLSLIDGLQYSLKKNGFDTEVARTVREAMTRLPEISRYDLLILDVTLPDGTGFDFCERVRKSGNPVSGTQPGSRLLSSGTGGFKNRHCQSPLRRCSKP